MNTFAQKQDRFPRPASLAPRSVSRNLSESNLTVSESNQRAVPILNLQRTIGNQAVQRLFRASAKKPEEFRVKNEPPSQISRVTSNVLQRERLTVKAEPPYTEEDDPYHPLTTTGHAYLELKHDQEDQPIARGFYPEWIHASPNDKSLALETFFGLDVPGEVRNDRNHAWTVRQDYEIDIDAYARALGRAEGLRALPPDYNLYSYNCVHFVEEIAQAAGVSLPNLPGIEEPIDLARRLSREGGELEPHGEVR